MPGFGAGHAAGWHVQGGENGGSGFISDDQHRENMNAQALATSDPRFVEWYKKQAQGVYGRELAPANAIAEGMQSGDTSAARYQQALALGGVQNQMGLAAAGGALAGRGAMYAGGQQGGQAVGAGAQARQGEIEGARNAQLAAYMRQMGYSMNLDQWAQQNAIGAENATAQLREIEAARQRGEQARMNAIITGGINAGSGLAGMGGQMLGGAGGGGDPYAGKSFAGTSGAEWGAFDAQSDERSKMHRAYASRSTEDGLIRGLASARGY